MVNKDTDNRWTVADGTAVGLWTLPDKEGADV
jgi:hypothetical protein